MSDSTPNTSNDDERLELALKASNEGIWDWTVGESSIYYSRRIIEFLGCPESSAPNLFLPPHEAIHTLDREAFSQSIEVSLQPNGRETIAEDVRIQTGDNNWRWLRIRGIIVRDRQGNAVRVAGSMIDISLRKNAEAQIEEERHILRTLIDHVPLQIYYKDTESHIVMANQGMADYHGIKSSSEMIGKHDRDLFSNTHWEKAAADEQRIIATGIPMTGQLERETYEENKETFVLTSKFPWRDRSGSIKGTFGVSSDVTSLVRAQRQATQLANELRRKNIAYEEEVNLAREIQQALIRSGQSTVRASCGYEVTFDSRYLPISGLAGDFFEIFELEDDHFGVFICDVMGHGVRAALIVSMIRGLLSTNHASRHNPSHFIQEVNSSLAKILKNAGITMFATASYSVIDLKTGQLRMACAGHPGPVALEKGTAKQLFTERSHKGPALGLIESAAYPENSFDASETDRLLLFTDGVLEAEDDQGDRFMESRLIGAIQQSGNATNDQWLDQIIETVLDFSADHHFDDDVCLLGLDLRKTK